MAHDTSKTDRPTRNDPMPRPAPRLVTHGPAALAVRRLKVAAHQVRRLARWAADPAFAPLPHGSPAGHPILLGRETVRIDRSDPDADPRFEAGKRHNLRLAAPFFDGRIINPGQPLSFCRALGRATASRGFVYGLELRGGCLVPALGGGVCLLSNTLFALAARLGWHIHERHGHSMEAVPPPPGTVWGLDATIFWPYVDLRVSPRHGPVRLTVRVADGRLDVAAYGDRAQPRAYRLHVEGDRIIEEGEHRFRVGELWRRAHDPRTGAPLAPAEPIARSRRRLLHSVERRRSCLTCGETACHARPDIVPLRLLDPPGEAAR